MTKEVKHICDEIIRLEKESAEIGKMLGVSRHMLSRAIQSEDEEVKEVLKYMDIIRAVK